MNRLSQLTIRCFGGFEARLGEHPITAFESNKVRALLAYLVTQRDRVFSREHLATLLWPEKSAEASRRNLRQAVYNLKSAIAAEPTGAPIVVANSHDLGIGPGVDCWLDVEAFCEARQRGITSEAIVPHYLAGAVALYRGDFLAGFNLKDSAEFEFWQLAQQERLRDQAIDVLHKLVDSYLTRGEFRLGIQYARRLVAVDPLSEQAHRYLIRLYSASGARNRALAEYEQLRATLHRELGVEPLEETRELYQGILSDGRSESREEGGRGIGPLIPLVGRQEPYRRLRDHWQSVLAGRCRLTVVEGESGVGKTRLVKSFLDAASSRRLISIVKGRCSEDTPRAYQPLAEVIRNAVFEDSQQPRSALEQAPIEMMADLALLAPELREILPRLPAAGGARVARDRLFESIARLFELLSRPADARPPLVFLLSGLQWAGAETFELLDFLLERQADAPIWILATCSTIGGEPPPARRRLADQGPDAPARWIHLERFEPASVEEIASALFGDEDAGELSGLLNRHGEGLPIAVAEWINSLWDECVLTHEAGRWHLRDSLTGMSGDLEALIQRRLQRLPTSTRRLASQAAVMGEQFDARLLKEAANEHPQVVEVGLELLLERWLIRQHSEYWMSGRREHDIVLWAQGARLGRFEFSHRLIRRSVLDDVNPLRRQVMHREVAATLERNFGRGAERLSETLAFHYTQACEWRQAIGPLEQAFDKARAVSARDTARHYGRQVVEVAGRLAAAAPAPDEEDRWRRRGERAAVALEEITGA